MSWVITYVQCDSQVRIVKLQAPWRWSTETETCRRSEAKGYISVCALCWLFPLTGNGRSTPGKSSLVLYTASTTRGPIWLSNGTWISLPPARSGRYREEKSLSLSGIESRSLAHTVPRLVSIPNEVVELLERTILMNTKAEIFCTLNAPQKIDSVEDDVSY